MRFIDIETNKKISANLRRAFLNSRLSHALLFCGEESCGGLALAIALAQFISCNNRSENDSCGICPSCIKINKLVHPDLNFAVPVNSSSSNSADKKPCTDTYLAAWRQAVLANSHITEFAWYEIIGIENKQGVLNVTEANSISHKLSFKPFESDYKFMIIWLPEKMNLECSNKLLKILEEPTENTFFFLVSKQSHKLLPTIESRTLKIYLENCPIQSTFKSNEELRDLFFQTMNLVLKRDLLGLICLAEEIATLGREKHKEYCYQNLEYIRAMFLMSNGLDELISLNISDKNTIKEYIRNINPNFYEKINQAINLSLLNIERNVSSKAIFIELNNKFFTFSKNGNNN